MKNINKIIIPAILLILTLFLRLWQIGSIPVGFTPDEASFGYDAYSILHTGRDQWGHILPITLESFGDFKSPLYTYLTIPSVAVFGLTQFATRLPNALVGTGAVLVLYLLLGEIGRLSKLKDSKIKILQISGALFLAVSSWHVMMSRGAFEANLVTFFLPLGIYLFIRGTQYFKFLIPSAIVFGLSLFTYHSAKLLTPLILLSLVVIFREKLLENRKKFILPGVLFLAFFVVLLYSFKLGGGTRIVERSITQGALDEGAKIKIQLINEGMNPTLAKFLHNKYQVVFQRFTSNYFQYFSYNFLFAKGPAETTYGMIPGVGVLYVFEGILMAGLIPLLLSDKKIRSVFLALAFWLLLAPLPAALATGVGFAANRAEGMIPVLQILTAMGLVGWNIYFEKWNKKVLLLISVAAAALAANNLGLVAKTYFVKSPAIAAPGMLFGRGEAVNFADMNSGNYNKTIFSRTLSEPQIYVAFYSKFDPTAYQKESLKWSIYKDQNLSFLDQLGEYNLGKYIFKNIDYKLDSQIANTLLIGKPSDFPENIIPSKVILYPDLTPDIVFKETSSASK